MPSPESVAIDHVSVAIDHVATAIEQLAHNTGGATRVELAACIAAGIHAGSEDRLASAVGQKAVETLNAIEKGIRGT